MCTAQLEAIDAAITKAKEFSDDHWFMGWDHIVVRMLAGCICVQFARTDWFNLRMGACGLRKRVSTEKGMS